MPYVSRVLGADGVGTYSFAESIVSYFVLFAALGTNTYGQREISYLQNDRKHRSEVFWSTVALRTLTALAMLVVYGVFVVYITDNHILYAILALNLANIVLDTTWLFEGMEDFQTIAVRNIVVKLVCTVLIFVVVRSRDDLWLYAISMVAPIVLGSLALVPALFKIIDKPKFSELRPFGNIKTVISLFIPTIAISIYTVLDKTMLGIIAADAAQNGYYEQALKISRTALTVVVALGTVMVPRIGHLFASGEHEAVKQYMYKSYRFVFLVGVPLCFGLMGVSANFVPWFFGEGFEGVIPILQIASLLILAIGINNATGVQYLVPTKRQNLFTLTVLAGAICNFLLNLALIPLFQGVGAAIASVTAEALIAGMQLFLVRREIDSIEVFKPLWKYLISGLVMLAVLALLQGFLEPSLVNTALLIVVGALIYCGALVALRDDFFKTLIASTSNKFDL